MASYRGYSRYANYRSISQRPTSRAIGLSVWYQFWSFNEISYDVPFNIASVNNTRNVLQTDVSEKHDERIWLGAMKFARLFVANRVSRGKYIYLVVGNIIVPLKTVGARTRCIGRKLTALEIRFFETFPYDVRTDQSSNTVGQREQSKTLYLYFETRTVHPRRLHMSIIACMQLSFPNNAYLRSRKPRARKYPMFTLMTSTHST